MDEVREEQQTRAQVILPSYYKNEHSSAEKLLLLCVFIGNLLHASSGHFVLSKASVCSCFFFFQIVWIHMFNKLEMH